MLGKLTSITLYFLLIFLLIIFGNYCSGVDIRQTNIKKTPH